MKKRTFWRNLSDVLFQNAFLIILIIYLTRITFSVNKLTSAYDPSEMSYLSPLAIIVLAAAFLGQLFCLKRGADEEREKNRETDGNQKS